MHIEAELIHRCRLGNREAQRRFFELTSSRIYGLLLRMAGNADDAFDLTQETYIRAFTHLADFDGRASILTWLHRIAVNEALQLQRRIRMSNGKHRAMAAQKPDEHDGNGSLNLRMDMDTALATLTESDRAILLLRHQEGCDYRTIGEILDLPAGTVASRLSRARDQLRMLLRKGYGLAEEESPLVHQNMRRRVPSPSQGEGRVACDPPRRGEDVAVVAQGENPPARGDVADCQP